MNRDRPTRSRDDEDNKPKVAKECPWCGSSKKRPRNHKPNGTCNELCNRQIALYRQSYEPEPRGRRR